MPGRVCRCTLTEFNKQGTRRRGCSMTHINARTPRILRSAVSCPVPILRINREVAQGDLQRGRQPQATVALQAHRTMDFLRRLRAAAFAGLKASTRPVSRGSHRRSGVPPSSRLFQAEVGPRPIRSGSRAISVMRRLTLKDGEVFHTQSKKWLLTSSSFRRLRPKLGHIQGATLQGGRALSTALSDSISRPYLPGVGGSPTAVVTCLADPTVDRSMRHPLVSKNKNKKERESSVQCRTRRYKQHKRVNWYIVGHRCGWNFKDESCGTWW